MRAALLVGINYYEFVSPLYGCVDDAHSVKAVLDRNADGSLNFECKLLTGTGSGDIVTRREVRDRVRGLFSQDLEIALFYFAGHGHIEATGGYLVASDATSGDEGISLTEVMALVTKSPARNKVIILDSCHSGIAGAIPGLEEVAALSSGTTILSASTAEQYASEVNGRGLFTSLMVDALYGGAANLIGDVTPGSVYSHIDQSMGAWDEQRPVFKTNVKEFVSLRKAQPPISLEDLRRIVELFPTPDHVFPLDPSFEPELKGRDPGMPSPVAANTEKFAVLQRYNRLNLLVPLGAAHMWNAAMGSHACKLTALGQHYHRLVAKGRL